MSAINSAARKIFFLGCLFLLLPACSIPSAPLTESPSVIDNTPVVQPTLVRFPQATLRPTSPPATETATGIPPTATVPATPLSTGIGIRDVTYCTMDGIPLKMDILFPFTGNGPWPAVIYVHGGGWIGGSKLDQFGEVDVPALREAGYLSIAVSYRLAPQYPFPSMIQDVKCAVRYLRAHAKEYNLDPNRIGVRGASAGGHLVALLATADESTGWDVGEYLEYSSRVQAAVDYFGPTDLTDESVNGLIGKVGPLLFGTNEVNESMLAYASPVTYISAGDSPILIMHGDEDELVPLEQSNLFFNALTAMGVPAELIVVQKSRHGFEPIPGADSTIPTRAQLTELMIAFFDKYLKPSP